MTERPAACRLTELSGTDKDEKTEPRLEKNHTGRIRTASAVNRTNVNDPIHTMNSPVSEPEQPQGRSAKDRANHLANDGPKLYEVRSVPGKGLGAIALQNINPGTLILSESPAMRIPKARYTATYLQEIFDAIEDDSTKRAIMNLASAHGQSPGNWPCDITTTTIRNTSSTDKASETTIPSPKIHISVQGEERTRITDQHIARLSPTKSLMSIIMTNAISLESGSGIFLRCSRFNHACIPNATYTWQPTLQQETIYATKHIPEGEEILVSYVDAYSGPQQRAWELKSYGFECGCEICVDDGSGRGVFSESRDRRWRLDELYDRAGDLTVTDDDKIKDLLQEIVLLKEEGVLTVALSDRYLKLAGLCARKGDMRTAIAAGEQAIAFATLCAGPGYEGVLGAQEKWKTYKVVNAQDSAR